MLLAIPASNALANASVRFLHAVPGADPASLSADGAGLASVGFGKATGYSSVPAGEQALRLRSHGKTIAHLSQDLRSGGHYTVVAIKQRGGAGLRAFEDPSARGGRARVLAIAAAPELGVVDVSAGDKTLASGLGFGKGGEPVAVPPGAYTVRASRASGSAGALASTAGQAFPAGSASTVVLIGSGGERLRFVTLAGSSVAPRGAPGTGLGGLGGEGSLPWLLAALAALAAAILGGSGYGLAARRRGR
jgi:hypothetical protein